MVPPPLPTAVTFFVGVNGQQQGPFDMATLTAMARSGQITRQSLVWKAGMAGWAAAETVPELQTLFAQIPPPLNG
jgi:hypothetical protein